jgi:anti-sigma factor RsiW
MTDNKLHHQEQRTGTMRQIIPVTYFDIQALVDKELSWEREMEVRAYIDSNPAAQRQFEELQQQKKVLQKWWTDQNKLSH